MVSIIIPCYNQSQYLSETIESVISQVYKDWECIIVNDGSSDDTEEIALRYQKLDSRVKYIPLENGGVSRARNKGILASSGQYILPLDADDLIEKEYIDMAVSHLEAHPECKLVYSRAVFFGAEEGEWVLGDYSYERLLWENCIFCSAVFRRADYDKTSGYNVNMNTGWEDWDFWLTLLNKEDEVYQIDEVLFRYRQKAVSRNDGAYDDRERLYRQIMNNHPDKYEFLSGHELYYYSYFKQYEKALNDIKKARSYRLAIAISKVFRYICGITSNN